MSLVPNRVPVSHDACELSTLSASEIAHLRGFGKLGVVRDVVKIHTDIVSRYHVSFVPLPRNPVRRVLISPPFLNFALFLSLSAYLSASHAAAHLAGCRVQMKRSLPPVHPHQLHRIFPLQRETGHLSLTLRAHAQKCVGHLQSPCTQGHLVLPHTDINKDASE